MHYSCHCRPAWLQAPSQAATAVTSSKAATPAQPAMPAGEQPQELLQEQSVEQPLQQPQEHHVQGLRCR